MKHNIQLILASLFLIVQTSYAQNQGGQQAFNNRGTNNVFLGNFMNVNVKFDNRSSNRQNPVSNKSAQSKGSVQNRNANPSTAKSKQNENRQKEVAKRTVEQKRVLVSRSNSADNNPQIKAPAIQLAKASQPTQSFTQKSAITFGKKAERKFTPSAGKKIPAKYRAKSKFNLLSLFSRRNKKPKKIKVAKNNSSKKECAFLAFR